MGYYKTYIQCKAMEVKPITIRDFLALRPLGRGAFGLVHACEKRDCGKLYAMKQINKKRVQATERLKTVMQERDYLAMMNSKFVTGLKYAIVDEDTLYIILDHAAGLPQYTRHQGAPLVRRGRLWTARGRIP